VGSRLARLDAGRLAQQRRLSLTTNTSAKPTLHQRAMHEFKELAIISSYLYVTLGAVILMKTAEGASSRPVQIVLRVTRRRQRNYDTAYPRRAPHSAPACVLVWCKACRHQADADFNCSLPPACGRMQPTEG
jgi:hypothetical protein